ncbi:hypothetical protein GALMADRAFT_271748 [Galerina marginata CBS 339.88]|uniref:SAP domain-containing protein n=1 Tax=Galerina marginata (strain CBS 339.88) TaxID=685588 RepID=A0A067SJ22_GALM3|nr:hypothetical protein GALMADRAFT_271748 [Galerina marginata CBS 339.88]
MDAASMDTQADGLPFPGGIVDGQMTTQFFNIDIPLKNGLVELCRGFGLGVTGKKDELKARLRSFSSNKDDWRQIAPAPRRAHRGPKTGGIAKTKSVKQSARRAEEIFNKSQSHTVVPHLPNHLPTQAPAITATQHEAILGWAKTTSIEHSYVNKENRVEAGKARLRMAAAARHDLISSNSIPLEYTNARLDQIAASLSIMSSSIPQALAPSQDPASLAGISVIPTLPSTSTSGVTLPPSVLSTAFNTTPSNLSSITSCPPALHPLASAPPYPCSLVSLSTPAPVHSKVAPSSSNGKVATRTITLGNGTCLEFAASDVGPAPAISFANDLPQLNRMWDDTSKHWGGHSALIIKGCHIPIVYWKAVYARSKSAGCWKPGQWKRAKGSWSAWKSVVKRWRQSSENEFWDEFSDDSGQRLSYTAIVQRLAEQRKVRDKKLADCAREEYGERFELEFTFRKSGKPRVMETDQKIAEKYLLELAKKNRLPVGCDDVEDMDLDSD